jgi:hypothetical protein
MAGPVIGEYGWSGVAVGPGGDLEEFEHLVLERGELGLEDLDDLAGLGEVVALDAGEDLDHSGRAGGGQSRSSG